MSTSIATCIIKDDPDAITCIEVCDDDEDDWHRQIVLAMENYSTVEDHSVLVELMSAYICSFKTETKDFSKLKLKNLLIKHINNLYLYKSAINDKCNDEYMNKMVEIVTFLCNLEMESMCKDDKNIDVAQRILNYLNLYLYGSEMYIEHVLMKLKPIKRLVLAHVFRYFFKKYEVEDSSDEGFCREYILLLKWKEIDPQEATQSTINAILYNLYKKTSDSIQENDFLRNILMPSYESSTDVLLHILNSTSSLVNKYFEFKSNKSKENNLLIQMADGSDDDITEVNIMGMSNFTINETNESQNEIPLTENNEVEAVGPWENIEHDKNESESEQVLFPDSFNNNPNWITEQVTEIKPENPDTPPATPAPEPENQDQVDEATIQAKDIADNDDYDDNNKNNEHNNHLTTVTTITEKVINNNNNNNNKLNDINESDVVVESVIQECITSNDHVSFHDEVEIETSELKTNNNNTNNNNHNHHSDTDFEGSDSGCGSDGSPKSENDDHQRTQITESDEQLNHNDEAIESDNVQLNDNDVTIESDNNVQLNHDEITENVVQEEIIQTDEHLNHDEEHEEHEDDASEINDDWINHVSMTVIIDGDGNKYYKGNDNLKSAVIEKTSKTPEPEVGVEEEIVYDQNFDNEEDNSEIHNGEDSEETNRQEVEEQIVENDKNITYKNLSKLLNDNGYYYVPVVDELSQDDEFERIQVTKELRQRRRARILLYESPAVTTTTTTTNNDLSKSEGFVNARSWPLKEGRLVFGPKSNERKRKSGSILVTNSQKKRPRGRPKTVSFPE